MKKFTVLLFGVMIVMIGYSLQRGYADDRYIKLACDYNATIDIIDWRNLPTQYDKGTDIFIIDKVNREVLDNKGEPFKEFTRSVGVVKDFNKEQNYIKISYDGEENNRPYHAFLYLNGKDLEYYSSLRVATYGIIRKETFPSTTAVKRGYCRVVPMQSAQF